MFFKNRRRKKKKKVEFAKFILAFYALACVAWIQQNFALAFLDKQQINESVTNTIIVSLAASILGYYGKSLGEKHSRNKARIDENGRPFSEGESEGG
jgi:hypothetical protein